MECKKKKKIMNTKINTLMIQFDNFIMYNADTTDRELPLNYSCYALKKRTELKCNVLVYVHSQ